jgi:hypothetical protein
MTHRSQQEPFALADGRLINMAPHTSRHHRRGFQFVRDDIVIIPAICRIREARPLGHHFAIWLLYGERNLPSVYQGE